MPASTDNTGPRGTRNPLSSTSLVSISDLDRNNIDLIMRESDRMREAFRARKSPAELRGRRMAALFYEPSTRTRLSFEIAMKELGGDVVWADMRSSSAMKGESLEDTIRIISSMSDIIVLRHYEKGSAGIARKFSSVPVINAGDGHGEHPTQALMDLFTIRVEKGKLEGLKIAVVGDLKYARTIHSLAYALGMYDNDLVFISPDELSLPEEIRGELAASGRRMEFSGSLDAALDADVVYIPRMQKERFESEQAYDRFAGHYKVDMAFMKRAKSDVIIMSPGPRIMEISTDVDGLKNAVYFKQPTYGIPVRMALLNMILGSRLMG